MGTGSATPCQERREQETPEKLRVVHHEFHAQFVQNVFEQMLFLGLRPLAVLSSNMLSTSIVLRARAGSQHCSPVSGLGTSPSCTNAEDARESTKVENVTSGQHARPGLNAGFLISAHTRLPAVRDVRPAAKPGRTPGLIVKIPRCRNGCVASVFNGYRVTRVRILPTPNEPG